MCLSCKMKLMIIDSVLIVCFQSYEKDGQSIWRDTTHIVWGLFTTAAGNERKRNEKVCFSGKNE